MAFRNQFTHVFDSDGCVLGEETPDDATFGGDKVCEAVLRSEVIQVKVMGMRMDAR